uniref:N-acetyltransferase domain-containing protein n=1 Tax=Panagrolaimus sp. PS1159 TaxID=55785 RepID=A0AC35FB40_9BILA
MTSITGLSPVTSQSEIKDELTFVIGNLNKHYEILSKMFIYEYSQEAPVTKAIGAKPEEIKESYLETCKESLNSQFSILAFSGDKCIGWVLNYITTEIKECFEDPNLSFNSDFTAKIANKGYSNTKENKISVVIDEISRNFSFFIPNCKKLFVLDVVFVQQSFGGKGIATKLIKKSIELARENECDWIMAIPTNIKSAHIFSKFGFKCVREIPFNEFKENGETFLKDFKDGNKSVRLMFLKL